MAKARMDAEMQSTKKLPAGKTFTVLNVEDDTVPNLPKGSEVVYPFCLLFSPDGDTLFAGYTNFMIQAFDLTANKLTPKYHPMKSRFGGFPITCMRIHPKNKGKLISSSGNGKMFTSDLKEDDGTEIIREPNNEIYVFDYSLKGDMLVTGGRDLTLRMYDANTNKLLEEWGGHSVPDINRQVTNGQSQKVFSIRFHPEQNSIFVSGGWDNTIKIWDTRLRDPVVNSLPGPHICGDGIDIKGNKILTASWVRNDALQLWDFQYKKIIKSIPFEQPTPDNKNSPGEYLYSCRICDGDVVVAGGAGENKVKAIRMSDNQIFGSCAMDKAVCCLDITYGGKRMAAGSLGGHLCSMSMV